MFQRLLYPSSKCFQLVSKISANRGHFALIIPININVNTTALQSNISTFSKQAIQAADHGLFFSHCLWPITLSAAFLQQNRICWYRDQSKRVPCSMCCLSACLFVCWDRATFHKLSANDSSWLTQRALLSQHLTLSDNDQCLPMMQSYQAWTRASTVVLRKALGKGPAQRNAIFFSPNNDDILCLWTHLVNSMQTCALTPTSIFDVGHGRGIFIRIYFFLFFFHRSTFECVGFLHLNLDLAISYIAASKRAVKLMRNYTLTTPPSSVRTRTVYRARVASSRR